jgi:hypothetical protein
VIEQTERVLGAASLLGTIVALLYSLWYPSLEDTANLSAAADPESRKKQAEAIWRVFRTKALPLAIASCLPAIVFLPVTVAILVNGLSTITTAGLLLALKAYDPVQAAFATVYLVSLGLVGVTVRAAISVRDRALLFSRG